MRWIAVDVVLLPFVPVTPMIRSGGTAIVNSCMPPTILVAGAVATRSAAPAYTVHARRPDDDVAARELGRRAVAGEAPDDR